MEAKKPISLGQSLPVPCVQELVKGNLTTVPARYVRPDQDPPTVTHTSSLPQIPVIDLQKLLAGAGDHDQHAKDPEIEKFHLACKDWGFFQLTNHGVRNDLVERVKKEIEEFFKLPIEEKKKWWQKPGGGMEGFGQVFVVSEEQKLDWADMFYITTLPTHLRNPNLFPTLPPPLRDTLEAYSTELRDLALKLLDTMARALKMEGEDMKHVFEEGWMSMRMNYYPPCPEPEQVIGLTPHSDAGGLTILLQLNETEGLQIKRDGVWIPVKPIPNAFVINIGNALEIVTNGIYPSIEHRAVVNSEKERLSVATFYGPQMDGGIGPAPSLITPATPALFRQIGVADYYRGYFSRELVGKSYMDTMRICDCDAKSLL